MSKAAARSNAGTVDAIAPAATLGEFVTRAQAIATLPDLTDLFAATIASRRYDGHICIATPHTAGPVPLFGDLACIPRKALRALTPDLDQPHAIVHGGRHDLIVPVECWHDHPVHLILRGTGGAPNRDVLAGLHGLCEVYATYGYALFEQQRDVATASGLGIDQRRCLALVLTGHRDFEIADVLGLTPLSVRSHIDHAVLLLEAATRAQAVAVAARRGWLVGLEDAPDAGLKQNFQ